MNAIVITVDGKFIWQQLYGSAISLHERWFLETMPEGMMFPFTERNEEFEKKLDYYRNFLHAYEKNGVEVIFKGEKVFE